LETIISLHDCFSPFVENEKERKNKNEKKTGDRTGPNTELINGGSPAGTGIISLYVVYKKIPTVTSTSPTPPQTRMPF
jgi:hypothetical protein